MKSNMPALLATLAVLAPLSFVTAGPPEMVVRMTQTKTFEPKTITVKTGETVVWRNVSDMPHSVTDVPSMAATAQDAALPPNAKEFDSGLVSPGKDYSHTFTVPGTYKYFCIPHEAVAMVGIVVVKRRLLPVGTAQELRALSAIHQQRKALRHGSEFFQQRPFRAAHRASAATI